MTSLRSTREADTPKRREVAIAWIVSALAALFAVLFLLLLIVNSRDPDVATYEYWLASLVIAIAFPLVGALIVSHNPDNVLGWVFCGIGFFTGAGDFATEYATYTLLVNPGSLPGGVFAAWVSSYASDIGFVSLPLVLLLFPDGRPATRRWRPVVLITVGAVAVIALSSAFAPGTAGTFTMVENPVGIEGTSGFFDVVGGVAFAVISLSLFAGIASLVVRYRRSRGFERQQLKWFTLAGALVPLGLVANTLYPDLAWLFGGVSTLLIPLAVGIAVLRYRLYDIDIVVNRALVYGGLTVGVVGLYMLVVGGIGALLQVRGNLLLSILAAGVVAVLFQPVRDRLQGAVNQLMYGERDDPYGVLSRLSQRLRATISPDAVLVTIVETVAAALKLPHVAIALKREDGEFYTVAEHGLPSQSDPLILPLSYGTETIGQLVLSPRAVGEPFSESDRRILDDVARHAEAAIYAARLTNDLQRSRERLVNVREEERRRLRRDLHDDLGPQLATITLKLDAVRNLLTSQPETADALLVELKAQAQSAIGDIRRVVYDLRPPSLDELGLVPAIREQAASFSQNGLRVTMDAPDKIPLLPAAVEVAAYRIVQEALTNVGHHAHARKCCIRFCLGDGLLMEIVDDGVGLSSNHRAGVGLASMRERAAELGGTCTVENLGSGGTRVTAWLPLPQAKEIQ